MSQEFRVLDPVQTAPVAAAIPRPEDSTGKAATKDIAYGSLAGMIGKIFEYPFDTIKVRLQSQPDDRPLRYRGPLDCFSQSLRQDGLRGMYRGISSPLIGAAAENSSLFFSYNIAQSFVRRNFYPDRDTKDTLPLGALVTCGALSGSFTSFILTPIELIKCKMQVQSMTVALPGHIRPGPIALIGEVYRTYGMRGFWNGQMGTFLRETGGGAAWFGSYEYVSEVLRRRSNTENLSAGKMMLSGAAAGVSYNLILFPADSIKSRMQTEVIGANSTKKGFFEVGANIYRAGGVKALYRGCGITCFRSAPSSALIFLCYEKLKEWF